MDSNMAQIPFIEHKKRMYKAYCRERNLKLLLIISNVFWVLIALLLYMR